MHYFVVMPAAGAGRRFGEARPKQYAPLAGRTVIEWALAPFLADKRCAGVVVALAAGDQYWAEVAAGLSPDSRSGISLAAGGTERCHSVLNGLRALEGRAGEDEWVLVHDAARPCLPRRDLDRLLERLEAHPLGGLLAAPAADTLKREGDAREVAGTVDRTGLWRALTPQMFRHRRLSAALQGALAAGRTPTDEAQALEWLGERPVLVEGSAANIKVTSAEDLLLAAALLTASR
jgi:2-C-methyl-D-erythritol 4-phosphate cytidylyltransferase